MTVHLRHPELPEDQTIEVAEAAVPLHRAAGWVVIEPPTKPIDADADADVTEPPAARKRRRTTEGE